MDWNRYKQLCDRPHVLSRWMLEQTIELMGGDRPAGVEMLERVLAGVSLDKPADHTGGGATDMFELHLPRALVVSIVRRVEWAVRMGQTSPATRQRGLGGFGEAWGEYADYLSADVSSVDVPAHSDC